VREAMPRDREGRAWEDKAAGKEGGGATGKGGRHIGGSREARRRGGREAHTCVEFEESNSDDNRLSGRHGRLSCRLLWRAMTKRFLTITQD